MRKWWDKAGIALAALLATITGAAAQGDRSPFTVGGPGGLNERGGAVQRVQVQVVPERLNARRKNASQSDCHD